MLGPTPAAPASSLDFGTRALGINSPHTVSGHGGQRLSTTSVNRSRRPTVNFKAALPAVGSEDPEN